MNKTEMPTWSETYDGFRTAKESWTLLHSHDALETGKQLICSVFSAFHINKLINP